MLFLEIVKTNCAVIVLLNFIFMCEMTTTTECFQCKSETDCISDGEHMICSECYETVWRNKPLKFKQPITNCTKCGDEIYGTKPSICGACAS